MKKLEWVCVGDSWSLISHEAIPSTSYPTPIFTHYRVEPSFNTYVVWYLSSTGMDKILKLCRNLEEAKNYCEVCYMMEVEHE